MPDDYDGGQNGSNSADQGSTNAVKHDHPARLTTARDHLATSSDRSSELPDPGEPQ
jgi:hypothetical protein